MVHPHVTPDTLKTETAANPDGWGKENNMNSLLASNKGSRPRPRGGAATLVPPHGCHDAGDDMSTAFNIMGSQPQCTTNNTIFLSGRSLVHGAGKSRTQYTAKRTTQCTVEGLELDPPWRAG